MAVFTVHAPPMKAHEAAPDPVRFAFVRDGFYVWGFLLSLFWMLRHRLWLAAVLFVALAILLEVALRLLGFGSGLRLFAFVALAFLVGLEGATLRRWSLSRRGWRQAGVVIADNQDEAERRFFSETHERTPRPSASPADTPPAYFAPAPGEVIGSFPQPERPR